MLLFSILNSGLFGVFADSALHRFDSKGAEKLEDIQNQMVEHMLDSWGSLLSIQNICKVAHAKYGCKVGDYYSPVVIMNCIKHIFSKNRDKL